jgi:DNA-binding transcriptional LysR family regulator
VGDIVKLTVLVVNHGLSDLRAEAIDVAIRFGRVPPEDLDSEFLFEDRFLPVASADIWRQGTTIADLPLIHYRWKRQRAGADLGALGRRGVAD